MAEQEPPEVLQAKPRKRRIAKRIALVGLILALVSAGAYRIAGDVTFNSAATAARSGDCRKAIDGFERVESWYRFDLSPNIAKSREHRAECRAFLVADGIPVDHPGTRVTALRAFLRSHPHGLLAPTASDHIAATYFTWGAGQVDRKDYTGGIPPLSTLIHDFPGTAWAGKAQSKVDELLVFAHQKLRTKRACTSLEIVDAALHNDLNVDRTEPLLPDALYQCALVTYREDISLGPALADLDRLLEDFPHGRLAPAARELHVDVEVRQKDHFVLPELTEARPSGSAPPGQVVVAIENNEKYDVRFLFSGEHSRELKIKGCSDCPSYPTGTQPACAGTEPIGTITLEPGVYRVVLTTDGPVEDAIGTWTLQAGVLYSDCYYIVT